MATNGSSNLIKILKINVPIAIILGLTLLLLAYVGYGEAQRNYLKFQLDKMATQSGIIEKSLDAFLQTSLPLKQFSGFSSQSRGILGSDPTLESVRIYNNRREEIFFGFQEGSDGNLIREEIDNRNYEPLKTQLDTERFRFRKSAASFQVELTLSSKFGTAGYVVIEAGRKAALKKMDAKYKQVFYHMGWIIGAFVLFIIFYEIFARNKNSRQGILKVAFILCFGLLATSIGTSVFDIYSEGALSKTKAFSDAMAQRLTAYVDLGLDFKDISGLEDTFLDFRDNNPDINSIALTENNINVIHTNKEKVGNTYNPLENSYEYVAELGETNGEKREFRVAVTIPVAVVMDKIKSSGKNFIVLFIACGLIALLFLEMSAGFLRYEGGGDVQTSSGGRAEDFGKALVMIKPAYFLLVFVNALAVPFLPQVVEHFSKIDGSSLASVSLPFTIYYLVFASVLIPAGQYAEHGSLKKLMAFGFIAEFIGLSLVAISTGYWSLTLGRVFSGAGQGIFLIGLQSYLLSVTPENRRTEGAAVKVIGRNSGLIAGSAIGALLYAFMDFRSVFIVASALSLASILYLLLLVPTEVPTEAQLAGKHKSRSPMRMFKNIMHSLKDPEFFKTLAFIGLISKMGITGVIMFAVPLILFKSDFASEDIGQALMLFYIASMIMTKYSSKLVDKAGKTKNVLFWSSVIGGIGMIFFGLFGVTEISQSGTPQFLLDVNMVGLMVKESIVELGSSYGIVALDKFLLIACLVLAGFSNGLSAAPIMTHITKTKAAQQYGNKSMTATYIFIERLGHVAGPAFIGYLLVFTNQSTLAISIFGGIFLFLGFVFLVTSKEA